MIYNPGIIDSSIPDLEIEKRDPGLQSPSEILVKNVIFSSYLTKVERSMICVSIISLTGWLMLGTVFMTMLYYLKLLTLLNCDLINFGNIKI